MQVSRKHSVYRYLSSGFITVNKFLARNIGLYEAIILGELISLNDYFESKGDLVDGLFYCTRAKLEEATTLTYRQSQEPIKRLEKLGLIKTFIMGLPAKTFFRIGEDEKNALESLFDGFDKMSKLDLPKTQDKVVHNIKTCIDKNDMQELTKPHNIIRTDYKNRQEEELNYLSDSALQSADIKNYTLQSSEQDTPKTFNQTDFQAQGATNVAESSVNTKPSKKSKREGKKGVLFRDSEEFDIEVFKQKMLNGGGKNKDLYANIDLEEWHEYMLDYSDAKGERRECWIATTKMFIRNNVNRDALKPKLYLKTYELSERSLKAKEFMRQMWYFDATNIETENYVNEMLAYFDSKPKEDYDEFATQVSAYRMNVFGNEIHKGCGVEYAIGIYKFFGTRTQEYKDGFLNRKNWEAYMEDILRKKGAKNG